jgi:phosphoglucomutase
MTISPLAGKPAPKEMLIDPARLEREYYERRPDLDDPQQLVSFGTSGHRGSPLRGSFTEAHILAITQAICDYRRAQGTDGPLYMGKDTHAVSGPAQRTALEVLAANAVQAIIQQDDGFTPTPVISRAILVYNRSRTEHLADGIVITPSHNPPEDGGFKYNPTNGGPADTDVTQWVENRANELLRNGNTGVKRVGFTTAFNADTTHQEDFILPYVNDLRNVVDMEAIRAAGIERRRPARRRRCALLGADQRRLQAEHCDRQSKGRSDLLVHDRRPRWRDPHGLLEPVRNGPARRPQGSLPGRLRQRY